MSTVERIALFIDGANLYASAKALGFDIDYKRLLKEFQAKGRLIRAFYYTALVDDQEYSSIRPLVDWLDYNGYSVVTKPTKEFVDSTGRRKVKGNMDIELAVDAMEMAEHVDLLVLFSGDGDFRSLVEAIQRKGVRVAVVSTISTQPPDGCRRTAPAGGRVHRFGPANSADWPRSGRSAGAGGEPPAPAICAWSSSQSKSRCANRRFASACCDWPSTSGRRATARRVRGLSSIATRIARPFPTGRTPPSVHSGRRARGC